MSSRNQGRSPAQGRRMIVPPDPAKKPEVQIDGRTFLAEANQKSASMAAFVGAVAERLFLAEAQHKPICKMKDAEISSMMDRCFDIAHNWRIKLKTYEHERMVEIDGKIRSSTSLILPDSSLVLDHMPMNSIPHMGG